MVSRIAILLAALMVVGGVTQAATYTKVADADGTIGISGTTAYSWINAFGEADVRVGVQGPYVRRAIMKFNIDWGQVQPTITSATLKLDVDGLDVTPFTVKIYAVTEDFTATYPHTDYYNRTLGTAWTTAGGTYDSGSGVSRTFTAAYSLVDFDVLSVVQYMQNNQSTTFGLLIIDDPAEATGYGARIDSLEATDENVQVPTLVIDSIPEPASLALLAMGGFGLLLRRRRR